MGSVIEEIGDAVISDVLQEAVDELRGRSKRKWAVILIAVLVGGVTATIIIRRRRRAASVSEPTPEGAPV